MSSSSSCSCELAVLRPPGINPTSAQDQDLQIEELDNVLGVFLAVRECAMDMARLNVAQLDRHQRWRSACAQIICATQRAEKLLQDLLPIEVLNQLRIVAKFKKIIDLAAEQTPAAFAKGAEHLWDPTSQIREIANEILTLLGATPAKDTDAQDR